VPAIHSARLTKQDEDDLTWFLGQVVFHRSTLGPQLERAEMLAFGSDGRKHRREALWERDDQGVVVGQRQRVYCRETRSSDGGYEPEHQDLLRYSRVSTRLQRVERISHHGYVVLTLHYGNAGQRWAGQEQGRIWCLTPLTFAGQRAVDELAAKRKREGQPVSPLQPVEQLAEEEAFNRTHPSEVRTRLVRRLLDGAERLLWDAHEAWNRAGWLEHLDEQAGVR
jgi:hypothetical protein